MANSDTNTPYVGITMVTYNHGNFIEQAIESVMMQQTGFSYRLFIGEDCSTDNTREICIKMKQKYPEAIELVLNEKNMGGLRNANNLLEKIRAANVTFVAQLDGDDYWTDKLKLQKQVDILEQHKDCSICFSKVNVITDATGNISEALPADDIATKTSFVVFLEKGLRIYSCTILYRLQNLPVVIPEWISKTIKGDWVLNSFLIEKGHAYFLTDTTAVYRVHGGGVIKSTTTINLAENSIFTIQMVRDYFSPKYQAEFGNILTWSYFHLAFNYLDATMPAGFLKSISNAQKAGEAKTGGWYWVVAKTTSKKIGRKIYNRIKHPFS